MNNYNKNIILLDETDKIIGTEKAIKAHQAQFLKLHRAFSVFIFNSKNELLIQRRSKEKLVFPNKWANTCCSHPFLNKLSFSNPVEDCKLHAIERLNYELGLDNQIKSDDLIFYDRLLYKASGNETFGWKMGCENIGEQEYKDFNGDGDYDLNKFESSDFAEYEIDYIFFCIKDVKQSINKSEVAEVAYVTKEDLSNIFKRNEYAPWFKMIDDYIGIFKMLETNIKNALS